MVSKIEWSSGDFNRPHIILPVPIRERILLRQRGENVNDSAAHGEFTACLHLDNSSRGPVPPVVAVKLLRIDHVP